MTGHVALLLVPADAPRELWHEKRDGGVTASEAHSIASGSIETHRRILDAKLNGASFRGTSATRRGHEREPFLLAYAATIAECAADGGLWGHPEHALHMATPDGSGTHPDLGPFGVEVKSHDHNWTRGTIPPDHFDQMQFGMWVLGFDQWLYVWEVLGEDGEPTGEEPQHRWVPRDEARIARLVAEAETFIAWRAAGAPALSDLTDAEDELLTAEAADAATESVVKRRRADRKPDVVAFLDQRGSDVTVRVAGTRASIVRTADDTRVLDEAAWKADRPDVYADYEEALQRAADAAAHAKDLAADALTSYFTTETKLGSVRIATLKEKTK